MPSDSTRPNSAAEEPHGLTNADQVDSGITGRAQADEGYPDDPMRVERGSTPDGRLLLYFTFPRSGDTPDGATAATPAAAQRDQQEAGQ